ncbi:hypothetical protein BDR04DRAFT_265471 [Suillus decipiens]|nr:hypothetical protein BDR04DRAFT_265471 [Suillus decipiens]
MDPGHLLVFVLVLFTDCMLNDISISDEHGYLQLEVFLPGHIRHRDSFELRPNRVILAISLVAVYHDEHRYSPLFLTGSARPCDRRALVWFSLHISWSSR